MAHEVLVGHVASAVQRHRVVGHEQLVVHAVVVALELAGRKRDAQHRRADAQRQGIEQTHLGARLGSQAGKQIVDLGGMEVVHQQAHTHAAACGVTQLAQHRAAGVVALQVVGLHVQ